MSGAVVTECPYGSLSRIADEHPWKRGTIPFAQPRCQCADSVPRTGRGLFGVGRRGNEANWLGYRGEDAVSGLVLGYRL